MMDLYESLGHNLTGTAIDISGETIYICKNCGMRVMYSFYEGDDVVIVNGKYYTFFTPKCSEMLLESIMK